MMWWPTFSPASNGSVHIFVTASRAELAWIVHIPGRPENANGNPLKASADLR
jgi:hypothetical protein